MTIPASSTFPEAMDDDNNLFLVHDSLRVRLAEDYNPGDTFVEVEGDPEVMLKFPPTGIITLTEQCSVEFLLLLAPEEPTVFFRRLGNLARVCGS
jgi:hypothetical protein